MAVMHVARQFTKMVHSPANLLAQSKRYLLPVGRLLQYLVRPDGLSMKNTILCAFGALALHQSLLHNNELGAFTLHGRKDSSARDKKYLELHMGFQSTLRCKDWSWARKITYNNVFPDRNQAVYGSTRSYHYQNFVYEAQQIKVETRQNKKGRKPGALLEMLLASLCVNSEEDFCVKRVVRLGYPPEACVSLSQIPTTGAVWKCIMPDNYTFPLTDQKAAILWEKWIALDGSPLGSGYSKFVLLSVLEHFCGAFGEEGVSAMEALDIRTMSKSLQALDIIFDCHQDAAEKVDVLRVVMCGLAFYNSDQQNAYPASILVSAIQELFAGGENVSIGRQEYMVKDHLEPEKKEEVLRLLSEADEAMSLNIEIMAFSHWGLQYLALVTKFLEDKAMGAGHRKEAVLAEFSPTRSVISELRASTTTTDKKRVLSRFFSANERV